MMTRMVDPMRPRSNLHQEFLRPVGPSFPPASAHVVGALLLLLGLAVAPHRSLGQATAEDRTIAVLEIPEDDGSPDPVKTYAVQYLAMVAGIPFTTTSSLDSATAHSVVIPTSGLDGNTFTDEQRSKLRSYVDGGGVLIASNFKDTKLFDVFGIGGESFSRKRYRINFLDGKLSDKFEWIDEPREQTVSLGDTSRSTVIFSRGYSLRGATALARFDDGSPAITRHPYGDGYAYLLGVSIRDVTIRNQMNRDFTAQRAFSNGFDPTTDVFSLFVRSVFREHVPHTVWKHTAPIDSRSAVIVTHDVDSESGMRLMNQFASFEQKLDITASYYITTHYVDDFLAGDYYTPYRESVRRLHEQGQHVGSHSVGHFPDFDELPLGAMGNNRDNYSPHYNGEQTVEGTIMGELEVSKALLEQDVPQKVVSFRAGYLLYPNKLVNALDTLGYRFNTTFSANDVMTSFPYRNVKGRTFSGPLSDVWEIPMTISDVFNDEPISEENYPEKVDVWQDVFNRYSANGSPVVLLIHPNREYKLAAEREFIRRLPSDVALISLESFGQFWLERASLDVSTTLEGNNLTIWIEDQDALPDSVSLIVDEAGGLDKLTLRNADGDSLSYETESREDGTLLLHSGKTSQRGGDEVHLLAPFPNPARTRVTVRYALPQRREVTLRVYDVLGRRVKTLASSREKGRQTKQVDVSDLSSGIYFLRLRAGGTVRTGRFTVVK